MITRFRILLGIDEVLDLAEFEAFKLDGTDYPGDWITRGGTIPNHTIEPYDATPPPPPPPVTSASGAQMVDEAKARNGLAVLLAALSESERATFYTRRRIIAGSDFAEVLRRELGINVAAMEAFIAAAAVREEV